MTDEFKPQSQTLATPPAPPVDADATLVQEVAEIEHAAELSRRRSAPPASIPGYVIVRPLGDGAYGSVWLAREQNTGKQVAIKFYSRRRGLDWSLLSREVEKLAALDTSRNIIGLLHVGWDSDPPYYIMEHLENGSLAAFLEDGPLPVADAVRIARSVLQALVHAHGRGILHCDLKPANVLLDTDFEPRLCDFGQSRLCDDQSPALGTLFYMAPEQADLKAVPDARWDVYAVGALLYQMLCGTPPFRTPENERRIRDAGTLEERLAAYREALSESPRPTGHRRMAGVDRRLAEIVDRCLAVNPTKRSPNAQAVLDALDLRERQRRRQPLVALGVIGPALLLIAMAIVFVNAMGDAVEQSRGSLVERALESNIVSAELLATGIRRELEDRLTELERIAADGRLRAAVLTAEQNGWTDRERIVELLADRRAAIDDYRRRFKRRTDTSWFLTDVRGYQRWRGPFDDKTHDENFSYRDYFHGLGREDRSQRQNPPIGRPHISIAFTSEATGQYMVALSVPVWDTERRQVIGVLARTMHLTDLLADYEDEIRGQDGADVNRVIALVDHRNGWKLLDHEWMTADNLETLPREMFEMLRLSPSARERLEREKRQAVGPGDVLPVVADAVYEDPFGRLDPEKYGGLWLAAFAPVGEIDPLGETGWTAIVQERRDDALRPIEQMQRDLRRWGLAALAASGLLIGLLWYFVARALHDRPARRKSHNGSARRPPGTTTLSGS